MPVAIPNQEQFKDVPVRRLLSMFRVYEDARSSYDKDWDRNVQFVRGNPWKGRPKLVPYESRPDYKKAGEFVEIMRAQLADNEWGLDSLPRNITEDDAKPAEVAQKALDINRTLDWVWDDVDLTGQLGRCFVNTFTIGTGILKATFDPEDISAGLGGIEAHPVDPTYIYPDPEATRVEDSTAIFEARPVSISWLRQHYPQFFGPGVNTKLAVDGAVSKRFQTPKRGSDASAEMPDSLRYDLLECWYHDATIEPISDSERFDPESEMTVKDWKSKYPNGRYTLMLSNGYVLVDKPAPYATFPYFTFRDIPLPGEFWGGSTISMAAPLLYQLNDVLQTITDAAHWMAHGIWMVPTQSGVDPKLLRKHGGPGYTIAYKPGMKPTRETGSALPNDILFLYTEVKSALDAVLGVQNIARGIAPSRQPVQTTMMQQEAGELRTRERIRGVKSELARLGAHILDMIRENWTDKRTISRVDAANGELQNFDITADDLKDWECKFVVRPASTRRMDRTFALQKALELKAAGVVIDDSYLLKLSGLPGIEDMLAEQQIAGEVPDEGLPGEIQPDGQTDQSVQEQPGADPMQQALEGLMGATGLAGPDGSGMLPTEGMMSLPMGGTGAGVPLA